MVLIALSVSLFLKKYKQEAEGSKRSPGYQRLYTDFLSKGLTFECQLPHHRINQNQQGHSKAALYSLNTIAINVMYIDRVEDNAYSL